MLNYLSGILFNNIVDHSYAFIRWFEPINCPLLRFRKTLADIFHLFPTRARLCHNSV